MLQSSLVRLVLSVAVTMLVAACAAGAAPGTGGADSESVSIRINNNLIPPSAITVYAVPQTGGRQLLGNVSPSSIQTFRYNPVGLTSGQYQILAQTTGSGEIVSREFTLVDVAAVEWDMSLNTIKLTEPGG